MQTLQDYYDWIEPQNVHDHHHVTSAIKKLQDEITENADKEKLKAEILAMDFMLEDSKIEGNFKTTSKEGHTTYEYPNPADITAGMIEYFFERVQKTNNFSAKARYAQVIANCSKGTVAGKAIKLLIDAYYEWLHELIAKPYVAGERCYMIRSAFENSYPHAIKSRYRLDDLGALLIKVVFTDGILSATFRVSMIGFIFEQRKHFEKTIMSDCLALSERMYQDGYGTELRALEDLHRVALSLIRSVGGDPKVWHNRLAAGYESEIEKNTHDKSGIGAMEECRNALEKYRLAKNQEKVAELSLRYAELRKKLKFGTIEHSFDTKELNKHFNQFKSSFKKILSKYSENEVIDFFVNEPTLFPQVSLLKKRIQDSPRNFMDYVTLLKLDINKNFQLKITGEQERELNKLYEAYHFDMQLFITHQLQLIFYFGYTHGKINYDTIIAYIKERTWMGKNLSRNDSGGELQTYHWISLLGPGIFHLFSILEMSFKKSEASVNMVLALDSLTLKFEGLLRDFARIAGAETIVQVKDVIREMYIDELLDTAQIQKLFAEDDRMLFRYVFVSKYGLNLRNQIAHCFLRARQYNIDKVLLVLVCILRLGKYTISVDNPVT